jgi:hypothetical protein
VTPRHYGSPPEDPWLVVPLPWVEKGEENAQRALWPALALGVIWLGLLWRRRWGYALALPVSFLLLGLILAFAELVLAEGWLPVIRNWMAGMACVLLVCEVGLAGVLSKLSKKPSWVSVMLLLAPVVVLFLAFLWTEVESPFRRAPEQRYLWAGWYWIGPLLLGRAVSLCWLAVAIWLTGGLLFVGIGHLGSRWAAGRSG